MKILLNGDLNMKLYNIYYICKSIFTDLKNLKGESTSSGAYKINNWIRYKNALQTLRTIDFISNDAVATYDVVNPIDAEKNVPEIGRNTYNDLMTKNNRS